MGTPSDLPPHPHVAEKVDEIKMHEDEKHVPLPDAIDKFIRYVGNVVCGVNGLLVLAIIGNVALRYGFSNGQIWLEELQWHLYGAGVMMGLSYAQVNDSHIRVDIFHARFSDRTKRIIEIIGILLFILPFIWVVFYHSLDFVADAWRTGERSDAPLGLPFRWAIKAVIPLSFGLLGLAILSRLYRDVYLLVKGR
ncbi:TRAP transporter small permease subunit [Terasakiella sp. A23]|uniref:TRAP transporter small permease subunit n=1 Tax=Terasakiella sp. FCG-A23 TaxID=3080561 RepID=UPI0029558480|nr:TRAP transporter small permease subunit [Terasakiella sp. A23]MDV7339354.1 TRAP transporter small permease subunit [Terasakiella sp. A23]